MTLGRRDFLQAALGAAAAGSIACRPRPRLDFGGRLLGQGVERGHRLRDGERPPVTRRSSAEVVIVGGGIAGLSAAWRLRRAGFDRFVLLELEDHPGGTSHGEAAYPWGAHYVPAPDASNRSLVMLLREVGAVDGERDDGSPAFAEHVLCRAPQERLFFRNRWYEGLYLRAGATPDDLRQLDAFNADVAMWAGRSDAQGRPAFRIPTTLASDDAAFLELDRLSMAEYMDARGWTSRRLRWLVDYACRDDYGLRLDETSAWAGMLYFAGRANEDDEREVLTWSEGNARLVRHLAGACDEGRLRTGAVVTDIVPGEESVEVRLFDAATGQGEAIEARHVICALPRFVARRVVAPLRERAHAPVRYGSWIVANVTLADRPLSRGFPESWDNVLYDSDSLGYVVASHQQGRDHGPTTWTWYLPLCGPNPPEIREELLRADWSRWADAVVSDLGRAHVGFERLVTGIDVWRWGHAMVRPEPGFFLGDARRAREPEGRIHFAHTDLSGVALFEEAHAHGVRAAEAVLRDRGERFEPF